MRTLTLFLLFVTSILSAQEVKITSFQVQINEHNQLFVEHEIKPSETVFSLSKFYGAKVSDVLLINGISQSDNIPIGTRIIFPFDPTLLKTPSKRQERDWVKVTYKVRPRETLYKISTIYFPQKQEDMFTRNRIRSFTLKPGKELVVGWWETSRETAETEKSTSLVDKLKKIIKQEESQTNPDPQPHTEPTQIDPTTTPDPVVQETDEISSATDPNSEIGELEQRKRELENLIDQLKKKKADLDTDPTDEVITDIEDPLESNDLEVDTTETDDFLEVRKLTINNGLAFWDKDGDDRTNLFVMHNNAKPESYIKLRYELTGKEVTAKVVCPIPKGLYPADIDLIISPGVALALGALDNPFQIEMHYYE